jgi:DNA replication and repair protein RecF
MLVDWVELTGFRSYPHVRLEPEVGINVLVGDNASGKTNVLEAIAYLASLRSFRNAADVALVNDEAEAAVVRGSVERGESSSLIEVEIPRQGRRRVQVNGQRPARSSDLLGHLRVVVFLPDDLDVVKRGPAYRRDFIDRTAVQLWPGAYLDQQEYERSVRQRNSLLRQEGRDADSTTLGVWNQRMSQAGAKVMERRAQTVDAIATWVRATYVQLAGEEADVRFEYVSKWEGTLETDLETGERAARLLAALEENDRIDRERRVTTVGPHRDEPVVYLNGKDTRSKASQGEQRTLMLAMRLASHEAITAAVGEPPALLLDDVFSELDRERAGALAGALPAAQTFITTARFEEVPVEGHRWTVEEATLR